MTKKLRVLLLLAFCTIIALASVTAFAAGSSSADSDTVAIEQAADGEATTESTEEGGFNLTIFMTAIILLVIVVVVVVISVISTTTLPIIEYFE